MLLDDLANELDNYYGRLNEIKNGMITKPFRKPDALILLEQCETFRIPVINGGLVDQPYILMKEFGVVKHKRDVWHSILEQTKSPGET